MVQGPTIFPLIYAVIAVRLISSWARAVSKAPTPTEQHKLTLKQLLHSRNLGDTLITSAKLRIVNIVGIALFVLWGFSPIGGQASLRFVSGTQAPLPFNDSISFIDYDSVYQMYYQSPYWTSNIGIVQAIFTTSMISSNKIKKGPQDAWSNLKIPAVSELNMGKDASGWYGLEDYFVDEDYVQNAFSGDGVPKDSNYVSLVGIPVAGLNSTGQNFTTNSTFVQDFDSWFIMDTMYMSASCDDLTYFSNNTPGVDFSLTPNWTVAASSNGLVMGTENVSRIDPGNTDPSAPRTLYFQATAANKSASPDLRHPTLEMVNTTCQLTSVSVSLNVSCVYDACHVAAIKPTSTSSGTPPHASNWTPLDANDPSLPSSFLGDFVNATMPRYFHSASAVEHYLADPSAPYTMDNNNLYPDYSSVSAAAFSLRLTQLLNSYYMANIAPGAVAGDLITKDWYSSDLGLNYNSTNATTFVTASVMALECHHQWLAVLILASVIMMLAGLACVILDVKVPEDMVTHTALGPLGGVVKEMYKDEYSAGSLVSVSSVKAGGGGAGGVTTSVSLVK